MGFWGRLCIACEVMTAEGDPCWPRCWNCGADLAALKEYDPNKSFGRSPSLDQGARLTEVLGPLERIQ